MNTLNLNTIGPAEQSLLNRQRGVKTTAGKEKDAAADDLKRLDKLKQACADLESVFMGTMIKAMRDTIPEGGYLQKSAGSDVYDSICDQQLSIYLSQGSGIGLGQTLFNQVVRREGLEDLAAENPDLGGLHYQKTIAPDLMRKDHLSGRKALTD